MPPEKNSPASGPRHIGIIMDGNGRWAKKRGLFRSQGHLEGLAAAKRIVAAASDMGISYLTLYTFSTENWKRTSEEIGFLLGLLKKYLREEREFCREKRIKVRHAGDRTALPQDILGELDDTCNATAGFEGLEVILAFNYGGRDEIIRAFKKLAAANDTITAETLAQYLDNPDVPDPDLIIRTAGEFRTSNFLLWQSAYSEYYISAKLWPDWEADDLAEAIQNYRSRERRFGAVT